MRPTVLLLALLLGAPAGAAEPKDPRALLRESLDLYVVGRYREAVEILRPLVESRVLTDRADQLEALRTYGISLFLIGARPGAERAFRDLLRLDPDAQLDPAFVRPEVVAFFEKVRGRYRLEVRTAERRGSRSVAVNLIPPWGQFRNGHRVKGYLVLSGELAFGVTSITTAALLYSWRDDTGQFPDHEAAYRPLSVLNYVSFGLAAAVVVYGILDGIYYHYKGPNPGVQASWLLGPNRQPLTSAVSF
jgi:tetratricopeptide (TPR) repeat protein